MEEAQYDRQSPSALGSTQDLPSWGINDHETGEGSARTTREQLVNDLKTAGTTVTKKTIGNTLRRNGLKSCSTLKIPLFKKAHVQARLKFSNEHLDDSENA